jgi:histidine ammonia-lyase
MILRLDGSSLSYAQLVDLAYGRAQAAFAPAAIERMEKARRIAEAAARARQQTYGHTTGVGARKQWAVDSAQADEFNRGVIETHRVGQGPNAPSPLVRATLARLANAFAKGTVAIRPELAQRLLAALNENRAFDVRLLGTNGCGDLAPLADLASALVQGIALRSGEGLGLINSNAFATAAACLALHRSERYLDSLLGVAACELDAFAATVDVILNEVIADIRPAPNLIDSVNRLRRALDGSALWQRGAARSLQDPLCFRSLPQVVGGARDTWDYARQQLDVALNASQENPVVDQKRERMTSICSFDIVPLSAALDYMRIALAGVLASACERSLKLLQHRFTGLPQGLTAASGEAQSGLDVFGQAAQAFAAEARLLAQPVSFDVTSTSQADGIEDRINMGHLSARRLDEMLVLGERLLAVQLVVACQALDLRRRQAPVAFGQTSEQAFAAVRRHVSFMTGLATFPADLQPLVDAVAAGAFALPADP